MSFVAFFTPPGQEASPARSKARRYALLQRCNPAAICCTAPLHQSCLRLHRLILHEQICCAEQHFLCRLHARTVSALQQPLHPVAHTRQRTSAQTHCVHLLDSSKLTSKFDVSDMFMHHVAFPLHALPASLAVAPFPPLKSQTVCP